MPRRREPTGRQRACTHMHAAMEGWGTLPSHSWNEAARMLRHAASAPESAINHSLHSLHSLHSFQNQTARAHTRASAPNSIRCSGNRGMGARGTVQSTRTHVWSPFGRDKLQSLFNERNSCSKFVPCQIVSVGRGGGSPPFHRRAAHVRTRVFGGGIFFFLADPLHQPLTHGCSWWCGPRRRSWSAWRPDCLHNG